MADVAASPFVVTSLSLSLDNEINVLLKNDYVEQETDIEDSTEMEEQYSTSIFLSDSFNEEKPLTFKHLLQHFAAYTQQKKSSMTYLMQLLIRHRPTPLYDMLPSTGKQLMYIDGSDVPSFTFPSSASSTIVVNESVSSLDSQSITLMPSNGSQNETTALSDLDNDCHPPFTNFRNATWSTVLPTTPSCKRKRLQPKSLPKAISLENGGKYMHFGLEAALAGKSPGQVLQHACLVQHARLYNRSPTFVPASIRKEAQISHPGYITEKQISALISKCSGLEKRTSRLQSEVDVLIIDLEKANSTTASNLSSSTLNSNSSWMRLS
ncbi:hypothetical protein OUZ56_005357 [Daphnia magna]|uniref:BEN domain-containing protein n=1 Tax=Daphnia magna TaxID=35525 RepID=A0ABQ9YSK6_9CRUS|nr:hypothetical protein OUZ56_005357 [Daphnia magna]